MLWNKNYLLIYMNNSYKLSGSSWLKYACITISELLHFPYFDKQVKNFASLLLFFKSYWSLYYSFSFYKLRSKWKKVTLLFLGKEKIIFAWINLCTWYHTLIIELMCFATFSVTETTSSIVCMHVCLSMIKPNLDN